MSNKEIKNYIENPPKGYIPIFAFRKVQGKWTMTINVKFVCMFKMRHGIPPEILNDWINKMSKESKAVVAMRDWKLFKQA